MDLFASNGQLVAVAFAHACAMLEIFLSAHLNMDVPKIPFSAPMVECVTSPIGKKRSPNFVVLSDRLRCFITI
ncbi:hypothetical protein [Paraburkholderia jirisanensis]